MTTSLVRPGGRTSAAAAMRKVSLRNLGAHKVRLLLTVLSVILGTAFVSGSFVFTDTLKSTFHGLFADTAKGVDVEVTNPQSNSSGVPLDDVAKIRGVPGVGRVQTGVGGPVVLLATTGKVVQGGGAPSIGQAYATPAQTLGDPFVFTSGRAPAADDEIALNPGAVRLAKLSIGRSTKLLVPSHGVMTVTLVGIYSTKTETGGYVGVVFTAAEADRLFTDGRHVATVDVARSADAAGVSQTVLRDRIAQVVPGLKVRTGAQVLADTQNGINKALSFVNYILQAFGAIAVLVGTFIIYNTFSMIVAQRLRELALLRALGASRRQVSRSVLLEAIVVGLIGSVLGITVGVGLAYGLRALLNSFNVGLPSGALRLEVRTVVVALIVGVGVTLVSAYAPARRAAKTPPVAAMRAEFASTGTSLRVRTIIGVVLAVISAALLAGGFAASSAGSGASLVGLGALGMILALLFGAPALSRPVVGALGAVLTHPFGEVGRLARTNAVRNPRRTAATAFALTLGLVLVTAIAVLGASTKSSINALIDNNVTADFILLGNNQFPVPPGVSPAVAAVDGVSSVVSLHNVDVRIKGKQATGSAVDGVLRGVQRYQIVSGRDDITGNNMIASQTYAEDHGWRVGSPVTMVSGDGRTVTPTVAGIYADDDLMGPWVLSGSVYDQVTPAADRGDVVVLVKARPGADLTTLRAGLESATNPFLIVQVEDREQFKGSQAKQINGLLAILYGLLALAIVIAVLGIINTLALSVVERRRELGMLRAIGMVRGQVRRTVYVESTLIALFGAIVGVALGLILGTLFVHTLRHEGLAHIAVPWGQIILLLVVSGLVGVGAALWPAFRSARTPPLAAITQD